MTQKYTINGKSKTQSDKTILAKSKDHAIVYNYFVN